MTNFFNNIFNKLILRLGAGGIFVCSSALSILTCGICVALAILKDGYSLQKRVWCVFVLSGLSIFFVGVLTLIPAPTVYSFMIFAVSILCFSPVLCVSTKRKREMEEQRELARFIDREFVHKEQPKQPDFCEEQVLEKKQTYGVSENIENKDKEKTKNYGVDFEHVKNVIRRMDYFGLNANDKKQVRELEVALVEAERGDFSEPIKNRINDGLSALLKIMSKYGV